LNNLIGFSFDQATHLLETKVMFDSKKISLIGPVSYAKSFMGRYFYVGANYYYTLGLVGWISQWDPITVTIVFIFIELIFYLFFTNFLKNKFNQLWALLCFLFITISPYLIIHSRFFWNPHFLIPLAILALYFGEKYFLKKQKRYIFLMAVCWGFAFSCHYSAVLWGLFFIFWLIKSKEFKTIKAYLIIGAGFVLGNLPWVFFEIKHGFYNTRTLFYVLTNSSSSRHLSSHYFVFSLMIFIIWIVLGLIWKIKNKKTGNLLLIFLSFVMFLIQLRFCLHYSPLDVFPGWSYLEQKKAADLILKNGCPEKFNIANTNQGDTRSYELRYLLNIRNCNPMGVEEYPKAEKLFLIAPINRPPETETVWEVNSLGKFKINRKENLNSEVIFYELEADPNFGMK
jgi:hypothetical protein